MSDEEKTRTIHIPGQPRGTAGDGRAIGEIPTQLITNTVVGELKIVDGPGAGQTKSVFSGTNQIGRGADSKIQLDFGDNTISRTQHAVIVYDTIRKAFDIVDGGKQNPVVVNGERLAGKRALISGDMVKIGLTTLRFNAV